MRQFRFVWLFLSIAVLAAVLFVLALHPRSGTFGGLVFLLSGWALPSICAMALALALAFLIPAGRALQFTIAFVLSAILGLNTALPRAVDVFTYAPRIDSSVDAPVEWGGDPRFNFVNIKRRPWGPVFATPFGARVRVAGDEGCGCFYFLDASDALYSDHLAASLFAVVGKRGATVDYGAKGVQTREDSDIHIDLSLRKREDAIDAAVEVIDHGRRIAAFRHSGIPMAALIERDGLGRGNLDKNFWENALDVLLHDNIWSYALNLLAPSYFPTAEIQAFFKAAGLNRAGSR